MAAARAGIRLGAALTLLLARSVSADVASGAPLPGVAESLSGPARTAFDSATLLLANHDSAGALVKFSQSYDLSKEPRLLYNMAICEKNLHHYARMRTLLEQYEREAGSTVTPAMQVNVDRALQAVDNLVGAVTLTVNEPGAAVTVDAEPAGTTPLPAPLVLDLGRHRVSVTKEGFETAVLSVVVAGGNAQSADVALLHKSTATYLAIDTDTGATISIDGKIAATGRYAGPVSPGSHELTVTESGKRTYEASVTLQDGETKHVDVTLDDEHRRWLVPWIVGAAVVVTAGAIVGGYFLAKGGTNGTSAPPPGQLGTINFSSFTR
jgi:hypothetical protein